MYNIILKSIYDIYFGYSITIIVFPELRSDSAHKAGRKSRAGGQIEGQDFHELPVGHLSIFLVNLTILIQIEKVLHVTTNGGVVHLNVSIVIECLQTHKAKT